MFAPDAPEHEKPQQNPAPGGPASRPSMLDRLRGLFGLGGSVRDDIEDALQAPATAADLTLQERVMLRNVLGLHELRVGDVMVPRADIIAVGIDQPLGAVLRVFRTAGHSRLPVHGETLDDPRGMVHIRDFVDHIASTVEAITAQRPKHTARLDEINLTQPLGEAKILRPVLFVPASMPALDLLVKMQATRTHMALVIDEYGGTDGLVSIEDIVETIVGDIEDEHDETSAPMIDKGADGSYTIDARASLEEVTAATGVDFLALSDSEDVDTLGGLISALANRVPVRGEIVSGPNGMEFEILDADPRRVKRLRVHFRDKPPSTALEEEAAAPGASGPTEREHG
jgi:CBS domain containing-hemolysin-like protein